MMDVEHNKVLPPAKGGKMSDLTGISPKPTVTGDQENDNVGGEKKDRPKRRSSKRRSGSKRRSSRRSIGDPEGIEIDESVYSLATLEDDSKQQEPSVTKRISKRLSIDPEGFESPSEIQGFQSSLWMDELPEEQTGKVIEKEVTSPRKDGEDVTMNGFWQRQAKRVAHSPWIHLNVSLIVASILSGIAMTLGDFNVTAENGGWQSRGTLIANRETQLMMASGYQEFLFNGGPEAWKELETNVQPGWENEDTDTLERRRLTTSKSTGLSSFAPMNAGRKLLPFSLDERLLQMIDQSESLLPGCDISWYTNWTQLEKETHLWPIWQASSKKDTILDPDLLLDICASEENTQAVLEENGLCFGCDDGCLPPFSVVLYARLTIPGGFQMKCEELSMKWSEYQASTESGWTQCVADMKATFDPTKTKVEVPASCPPGFSPTLVEETFDETSWVTYSSSIFATREEHVDALYELLDEFDRGTDKVYGAYDTQREDFNTIYVDAAVGRDMALACGSAFVTALAILLHTRSPFITLIGLLQIILSFPLSFFVYTFIGGLEFFPFLNFIGVFVVFALGADDIFVAVDKWKNARLEHPNASTEFVAAIALPDAACSMFLTTITTAIAFFGTAICPVAPIKLFAIFCGLLIMFDYLMCIMLVFPALCIYDRRLRAGRSNCCFACHCCHRFEAQSDDENADIEKQSLIRRILYAFYAGLHRVRWFLLFACLAGFAICVYFATTLELPTSADVRILEESNEFEQNYFWRQKLLYDALRKSEGSDVLVGFGLAPADTGDLNNPSEWSQLVLDPTFDPSSEEAQMFMAFLCPSLFEEDFAKLPAENYTCPFNQFEMWLEDQSQSENPSNAYANHCAGAEGIPVPQDSFHPCMIAWSQKVEETSVLSNEGKVKLIFFPFLSRVRWDSPFNDLDNEWNLVENWMNDAKERAPPGVNKFFFSSMDFWWYDTNGQMLSTAYGAAGIALAAAAIVIFFSSRSLTLTVFAIFTIGYVLTSVTATLVGLGWTLGFLESICFAILIGVSVDFVIHFCHAYAHLPGEVARSERTKFALIRMGPSILAAAFTTVAAAIIMLFTVITFFQKFALILFMTIIQATVGTFIIFLTLVDTIGPSNPTYLVDRCIGARKEEPWEKPSPDDVPTKDATARISAMSTRDSLRY